MLLNYFKSAMLLCGLLISLISCSKGDGIIAEPVPGPIIFPDPIVRKIIAGPNDFLEFEYNQHHEVTRYTAQWQYTTEGDIVRKEGNYLFQDNRLVKWTSESGQVNYTYSGNKLFKAESFYPNGSRLSDEVFEYDQDGRISTMVETIAKPSEGGAIKSKFSYTYLADGNLSRMDVYYKMNMQTDFELTYSKVYLEFDQQKNPEPAQIANHHLPGLRLFVNNPTLIKEISNGSPEQRFLRIRYTYNAEGYPLERIQQIEINGSLKPAIRFSYEY